MGEIKLLDCTLRDGGYLNEWQFGKKRICSIVEYLSKAKVDIIEVGFINSSYAYDINKTIVPSTRYFKNIVQNINNSESMLVGMIDFGTCDLKDIEYCKDSILDGIRVIFKKKL